jgi:hypothetical protein
MTPLSRVITQIQRDAADTATHDLRADIEIGFEVLDAAITQLNALRPGVDVIELISANAEVMETAFCGPSPPASANASGSTCGPAWP